MNITEKVAYIKGLVDGMEFESNTQEKKLLLNIVELLDQMANEVTDIHKEVETLDDFADELDNDLGELEDYAYSDDSDDEDCDDEDDNDFNYYDETMMRGRFSIECPKCG